MHTELSLPQRMARSNFCMLACDAARVAGCMQQAGAEALPKQELRAHEQKSCTAGLFTSQSAALPFSCSTRAPICQWIVLFTADQVPLLYHAPTGGCEGRARDEADAAVRAQQLLGRAAPVDGNRALRQLIRAHARRAAGGCSAGCASPPGQPRHASMLLPRRLRSGKAVPFRAF